jgi:hypothetical protein
MARFTGADGGNNGASALNYVQVAGTPQTISSAPNSIVDLNITTTGKPVQISVTGEGANANAGSWLRLNLFRDDVEIGNAIQMESSAASENVPFAINFIDDVQAGTYNYSARVTTLAGGNWTFGEAAGPVMNAVELTGFKGDRGLRGLTGDQGPQGEPGPAGSGGGDLVIPTAIKDENDSDFITFTRTNTGTARIDAPQDDLSLRSAADITLYAGTDGPGNVYIGWGDAEYTPDSPNRVATIGDIQAESNHGDFYFDATTLKVDSSNDMVLEANEGDGTIAAQIKVGAGYVPIDIAAYEVQENSFNTGDWSAAEWQQDGYGAGLIALTGMTNLEQYLNNFNGDFQKILINNSTLVVYNGASYGGGNATIYVSEAPIETTAVNDLTFIQSLRSGLRIDLDDSQMDLNAPNMDLGLYAGDDLDISAGDDIRFYSNNNNNSYQWRMTSDGMFELPGDGYISNPSQSSGDGYNNDTIHIVPDSDLNSDQYLIIDPTAPNHIHIRAGGTQDSSNADLIIGGELTNVRVSDGDRNVTISSKPLPQSMAHLNVNAVPGDNFITNDVVTATPGWTVEVDGISYQISDVYYDNPSPGQTTMVAPGAIFIYEGVYNVFAPQSTLQWEFDYNGTLYGPAGGYVTVAGITGEPGDNIFNVVADQNLVLQNGEGYGAYLNDSNSGLNQIATIGDLNNIYSGEVSFTVNGGSLGTMPTFNGAPLFSGTYVKTGPMVHFQIQVDMDNITNFGTGQYYVDLPFPAKYGYQVREGCLHDISADKQYAIGGHVFAGESRLKLFFTDTNGQDQEFDHNSPITLAIADNFHVSGTYITE